jgi:hypothetical protein
MSPPAKRRAESPAPSPHTAARKKPKASPTLKRSDMATGIGVNLNPKFDVFPAQLRATLRTAYRESIKIQMGYLNAGTFVLPSRGYIVVREHYIRPSKDPLEMKDSKESGYCLHTANIALLETFLVVNRERLVDVEETPVFVKLETEEQLANPDFVHLHSVRHGEIGWGFDINGCLFFYQTKIEDKKHCTDAMFVQRVEVKKEEIS